MARILHVADVHLDRAFRGLAFAGCDGPRRRVLLRRALERAVDLALERRADALTIGGDLFEAEHVTSDTVAFVHRQLARAGCPVIVASGNHDFSGLSSPYRTAAWPPNVVRRIEPRLEPLEVADAVIWSFGYSGRELLGDPLAGFRAPASDRTQLLMVHGIDLGQASAEPGRLGLRDEDVRAFGFDHGLLGHIHAGHVGAALSSPGTPVPLDPGEVLGGHGVLWVETSGRDVKVEAIPFDLASFQTVSLDIGGIGDSSALLDTLRQRLDALPGAAAARVSCRLHGRRAESLRVDADALAGALAGVALGVSVVDASEPEVDLEALAQEPNARGTALRHLLEADTDDGRRAALLLVDAFDHDLVLPA